MTRKNKNVRIYSWDPASTVSVELEEVEHWNTSGGDRRFEVYHDGVKIGIIESGMHQASRHLFGNVAHFYKSRRKWFAKPTGGGYGGMYSIDYESQSAAIRSLLQDAGIHR